MAVLIVWSPAAAAGGIAAAAEDDTFTVRGDRSHFVTHPTSDPVQSGDWVERNCVLIGNGQLRCYVADGPGGTVRAFSVAAGAAPVTAADIARQVETDFRRLPIAPGGIEVEPPTGWTLVNVDTIVLSGAEPQTFSTAVLGIPVTVLATPTRYVWDFGDDSPALATREPGARWPAPTVTHQYRRAGTHVIGLTTEWTGQFRLAGSTTWTPISGVARTSEQAPPLEVRAMHNALVTP